MKRRDLLLAIDPGYPECAYALANDGRLIGVGFGGYDTPIGPDSCDHVVLEVPCTRPNTPDSNDLIVIAVSGALMAGRYAFGGRVTEYRPTQWKGNTPKPAHHLRTLWPALDAAERALLGGARTRKAIEAACSRGAADRWHKQGARYYRASELPTVGRTKITHDILDAAALALYALCRIKKG